MENFEFDQFQNASCQAPNRQAASAEFPPRETEQNPDKRPSYKVGNIFQGLLEVKNIGVTHSSHGLRAISQKGVPKYCFNSFLYVQLGRRVDQPLLVKSI